MGEWDFYSGIINVAELKKYAMAKKLGISEVTLCKWFREKPTYQRKKEVHRVVNELLVEKQEEINDAINRLANR